MIGLIIELKAATVLPVNRAMYAKLTELMTDFDISIRAIIKGKKHNIKSKSIIVVSLKASFSLKNFPLASMENCQVAICF